MEGRAAAGDSGSASASARLWLRLADGGGWCRRPYRGVPYPEALRRNQTQSQALSSTPRTRRRPVSVSCDGAQLSGSWGVGGAPRNAVCAKIGIAGVAGLQVAGLCQQQHSLFFQKKKREAPRRRESRSPLLDCWHSPRTMSDDSYLATPMSSLGRGPARILQKGQFRRFSSKLCNVGTQDRHVGF